MYLVVLALPCIVGQLITPRRALLRIRPVAVTLLVVGVLFQVAAALAPATARTLVPLAFAAGLAAFTSVAWTSSRSRTATALAAGGALANLIPITIHGAMPVVVASRERLSAEAIREPLLVSAKHVEVDLDIGWNTPVTLLSDWIPIPSVAIISFGDVLLAASFIAIGVAVRRQTRSEAIGAPARTVWAQPAP